MIHPFMQALRPSDPNIYSTPYEFRDDMRLVWSNCRTYNPPHVPVRNMGEAMSDAWEKRWTMSGIEAKWDEEMHRQTLEEQVELSAARGPQSDVPCITTDIWLVTH